MGFKFNDPTPEFLGAFNALAHKRALTDDELEKFKTLMYENDPYVTNGWENRPQHLLYTLLPASSNPSPDQYKMADIVFANMLRRKIDDPAAFAEGLTEMRDQAGRGFFKLAEYLTAKRSLPIFKYVFTEEVQNVIGEAKPVADDPAVKK